MDQTHRVGQFAVLILATAALIGPGLALGGGKQYPTFFTAFKYKLDDGKAEFKGTVDSTKGGCVSGRKVVLYRKHSGKTKKVGGDRTGDKGKFTINLGSGPAQNGTYQAKVNKTKIGKSGNKNTCLSRTSGTIKRSN